MLWRGMFCCREEQSSNIGHDKDFETVHAAHPHDVGGLLSIYPYLSHSRHRDRRSLSNCAHVGECPWCRFLIDVFFGCLVYPAQLQKSAKKTRRPIRSIQQHSLRFRADLTILGDVHSGNIPEGVI
jgi:hypothetical protein